jgi:hypothetical protein
MTGLQSDLLTPYMPKDEYLIPAWLGCLRYAIESEEMLSAFREETGNQWKPGISSLDRMIDEAIGAEAEFIKQFAGWMNQDLWGQI